MTGKRGGAVKGLILFLCAMAAITFFSRTVYYGTLPKVGTRSISGGALIYTHTGENYAIESGEAAGLCLPVALDEYKLTVSDVYVRSRRMVNAGDTLLTFEPNTAAYALTCAERALERADEALAQWDWAYEQEWNKLEREKDSLSAKLREEKADVKALQAEYDSAVKAQRHMETQKTVSGVSRLEKMQDSLDAQSVCDTLKRLSENGWRVTADADWLIRSVNVKSGDEYSGLLPLLEYIPRGAQIRVGLPYEDPPDILESGAYVEVADASTQVRDVWEYAGMDMRDGKNWIWAAPSGDWPDMNALTGLTFKIESEYYQYLIPNRAISGNGFFVLDQRYGSWGQSEYYARRVELQTILRDDRYTALTGAYINSDTAIVDWDRPIRDGDTVVLPLE